MSITHGIHAMVWTGGWTPDQARHAISSSAEAGYDLVEICPIDPDQFDGDMTARLLEEHGLQVSASLGLSADTDVSSEDPDVVARGRERLSRALDVVRDSGGTTLCGVLYSKLGSYDGPATQRGRENSQEAVAWLADKAAASGITLVLEFCNRYETNIMNTTAETLAFIEAVDRSNVMAHLDTYHMNIEEHSMAEAVKAAAAAGRLGYVHVGESHRGALGPGRSRGRSSSPRCAASATTGSSPSSRSPRRWSTARSRTTWRSGATCGRTTPRWPVTPSRSPARGSRPEP